MKLDISDVHLFVCNSLEIPLTTPMNTSSKLRVALAARKHIVGLCIRFNIARPQQISDYFGYKDTPPVYYANRNYKTARRTDQVFRDRDDGLRREIEQELRAVPA